MSLPTIAEIKALKANQQIERILFHSKHQLLEGMIFEAIVDRKLFGSNCPESVEFIPCQTMVARIDQKAKDHVFVWFTAETKHRDTLLHTLADQYEVHEVVYDEGLTEFVVSAILGEKPKVELGEFLKKASGREAVLHNRNRAVRDEVRQNAAVYGGLWHGSEEKVFKSVILPRIFRDLRIEPYCPACWDLDRFFVFGGDIWNLEIKHKYPAPAGYFGLNVGQLEHAGKLTSCGIHYVHIVFVKPYWDDQHSTMEMLTDQEISSHVAIAGAVLGNEYVSELLKEVARLSPKKTSLTGENTLKFMRIFLEHFFAVGRYDEKSPEIWERVFKLLEGHPIGEPLTLARLEALRLHDKIA
jgi:hypothetical protein